MKKLLLVFLLLTACRSTPPEPAFNCRSTARTAAEAVPLLTGEWKQIIPNQQSDEDLGAILRITADSVYVYRDDALTGVYAWTLTDAPGGVRFTSTWGTQQLNLPYDNGSVDVCQTALRLTGPFADAGAFFYRRIQR
jgi:hypothetical protein